MTFLARLAINLSFILVVFGFFTVGLKAIGDFLDIYLSAEALFTLAGLLTIALSDLYLGRR